MLAQVDKQSQFQCASYAILPDDRNVCSPDMLHVASPGKTDVSIQSESVARQRESERCKHTIRLKFGFGLHMHSIGSANVRSNENVHRRSRCHTGVIVWHCSHTRVLIVRLY